jgi:hypothetical protein
MAKLIAEGLFDSSKLLIEEGANGEPKKHYIVGSFLKVDSRNQNGRLYPRDVVEPCIQEFIEKKVSHNRAVGELNHPHTPEIDLGRISHIIEDLHFEGNDVMGKARLLDTEQGKIAKVLCNEGLSFGVSLRALGDVDDEGIMLPGMNLIAIDLVADPSFATSFVDPILESKEYLIDGDKIVEKQYAVYEEAVTNKHASPDEVYKAFNNLINSLRTK